MITIPIFFKNNKNDSLLELNWILAMIRQAYQSFRLNYRTSFVSAETKLKMSIMTPS